MIKLGDKIRLTESEKDLLHCFVGEPAHPGTVQEHNAWVDHATNRVWTGETPEERLMRAILSDAKIAACFNPRPD